MLFLNSLLSCPFDVRIYLVGLIGVESNHLILHCEQAVSFEVSQDHRDANCCPHILFVFLIRRTQSLEWNDWVEEYKSSFKPKPKYFLKRVLPIDN